MSDAAGPPPRRLDPTEPLPETGRTEPLPETGRTEPLPETGRTEPLPETGRTEPLPETGRTEPLPDDEGPRAAPSAEHATWVMPAALAGRYEVIEHLSQSDEATLVRARPLSDEGDRGEVAIKLYHRSDPDYEVDVVRTLGETGSRRVVGIVEVGTDGGHPFEVMRYVPGGTLADLLAGRRLLDPDTVLRLVDQLTAGLHVIHSSPVEAIHRDVKPSNILLTGQEPLAVAIGDFGRLARAERLRRLVTRLGERTPALVGTRRYFSPQHMRGARIPAADWYSLGLIVHEALFGRHPFDDSRGQFNETAALDVLEGARIPLLPHPDARWNELLEGLTRFDPADRWGYAEVQDWLNGRAAPPPRGPKIPTSSADSFALGENAYRSPGELAVALLRDHRAGERLVTDIARLTELSRWVRQGGNAAAADRIRDLAAQFEQDDLSAARRLVSIARTLDPAVEPVFRGERIDGERLTALATTALDPERADERAVSTLRDLFASDALREYAQIVGQDPRLALVQDAWAANYALVDDTRTRARNVEVTTRLRERDTILFALALRLALATERDRDRIRRRALPALGDERALGQDWFARLMRLGTNHFTDAEDPRGGQAAAMSATLAGMLHEAARIAETGFIRRSAAEEPDFPDTPGGRREDVDYSEAADPPSRVGHHDTLPRPALPGYDPSWIFSARGRVNPLALLFRAVAIIGGTMVVFGLVRWIWLDAAVLVTPTLPARLWGNPGGPVGWWIGLHDAWTSAPALSAIDPLAAAGAWVPIVAGAVTIAVSLLARVSIRPPVTQFKDVPPTLGRRLGVVAAVALCIGVLTLWAPWTLLLSAPVLIALVATRYR